MPIVQVIIPNNLGATLDANFLAANKYDANPADLALSMPVSPPVIGAQGALGGALDKDFYVGKDGLLHQLPPGGAASVVTTFTVTPTTLDVAVDGTAVMSVLLSSLAAALPIPPSTQTTFAVVGANLEAAVDGTAPIQISLTALAAALNAASATPEQHVVSGAVVGTNLVLTLNDLSTVIIDVTSLLNVPSTQTTFGIVGANIEAAVDGTAPLQLPLATLATALLPSLPPDKYVVSAVLDILNNLTLTLSDASTVVVSLATLANTPSVQSTFQISGANIEAAVDGTAVQVVSLAALAAALAPFLPAETFLAGAIYNPLTFTLTLTLNDATTVVVNLQDLIPVTAISGIQGNGTAATPLKENFDNLPAAPAVLPATTKFVVSTDGTNNDGSQALEQSVADYLIMTGATPLAAGSIGTVPAPLAGQDTFFFRGDASWQPLSGIVGGSIQMFENDGLNGFFRLDQSAGPTDMQPWAAPQDCVIYGMSVTNENIGANATITFFKNGVALVPNIVLNPFLNAVTAVAPFPIVMARGDRLSVSGVGTSNDTILNIQWYATAAPPATTVLRNALP